jgi:hypothetical protein
MALKSKSSSYATPTQNLEGRLIAFRIATEKIIIALSLCVFANYLGAPNVVTVKGNS